MSWVIFRAAETSQDIESLRPPRFIHEDGVIRPYKEREGLGSQMLQVGQKTLHHHLSVVGPEVVNIFSVNQVQGKLPVIQSFCGCVFCSNEIKGNPLTRNVRPPTVQKKRCLLRHLVFIWMLSLTQHLMYFTAAVIQCSVSTSCWKTKLRLDAN